MTGRRLAILLFAAVFLAATALAQEMGSISGSVTDTTGASVPDATVTATGPAGFKQTAVTDAAGNYTIANVPPGAYDVTISRPGFQDSLTKAFAVKAGDTTKLDVTLKPAENVTQVTVQGEKAAAVETQNAQLTGTITRKEVADIGLNGRNFTQLITLAPGVSNQTGQDEASVGAKGSVKYSVNGGRVEYNTFDVDGSDVLNAGLNGSSSTLIVFPSIDAISEVKVLTSNYGAIYGRSASGTVLVTTKSGGNKFHGDAYEFVRNEVWNARNFFDQTRGAPLYRRNDFGFTLGGPIYIPGHFNVNKDKTFFFFSEEIRREKTPNDFNQGVPSLLERTGNFSDVCPFAEPGQGGLPGEAVFFTRLSNPDCPGVAVANNFGSFQTYPGNQVPIEPNAALLLNTGVIPPPNSSTGCNSSVDSCYDASVSLPTHWHEELFRIDHHLTPNLDANFRYIHDSWDTITPTPQWGFVQNSFPTIQNDFVGPGISLVGHLTAVGSATFLNDLSLSYTTDHISLAESSVQDVDSKRPADLTMGYLFNNGFAGKMPGIVIGGTNAAYGGFGFSADPSFEPYHHSNPTVTFRDDATRVTGPHIFSFGIHILSAEKNETNPASAADTGDLQGLLTFTNLNGITGTGNAFADFLYGRVRAYQQDSSQRKYYNRYKSAEPYFQDDWKPTPRATVNLGVRFNIFGSWHEKYNQAYNWTPETFNPAEAASVDPFIGYLVNPTTGSPIPLNPSKLDPRIINGIVQCGVDRVPASCATTHHGIEQLLPAPRLGFALDPSGTGRTSIRGGYGIFFFHGTGNEANTGSLEGSAPPVFDMTQSFPSSYECIGGIGAGCGFAGAAYPLNVTAIPTLTVWPYVQQWSLSVQHSLSRSIVTTIAYVGSKGTHLTAERQLNQLVPVPLSENPFNVGQPLTSSICNSYDGQQFTVNNNPIAAGQTGFLNLEAACFGLVAGRSFPDVNTLRQYAPGMGEIFSLENIANSHYNALQATIRRTAGRLNLSVAYTYGHSVDDASDRFDSTLVDSYNLRTNYASSNFDQRQLLNVAYIYDLPPFPGFGRVIQRLWAPDDQLARPYQPTNLMRRMLEGWELSGVTTAQTGTPFSVINGGSPATGVSVLDNAGVANGIGAGSYPDVVDFPHRNPPAGAINGKSFGPVLGNPEAFAAPRGLTFGTAGRNFLRNPDRMEWDTALLKHFKLGEFATLELRGEAFNLFNHPQFEVFNPDRGNTGSNVISCYGGSRNSASYVGGGVNCLEGNAFLHPVAAHRPRTIQFGAKIIF